VSKLEPPRDPKMLLKEMSARIKIKDIQRLYKLRDRVAVKWYESGLVGLLFVAALSFLAIIIKLIPEANPLIRGFVLVSSVTLILIVTAILEFLLKKFHALRELYEHQTRVLEQLDKEVAELRKQIKELADTLQGGKDEKTGESSPRPDDPAR